MHVNRVLSGIAVSFVEIECRRMLPVRDRERHFRVDYSTLAITIVWYIGERTADTLISNVGLS
jgi:hypothetical protein